MNHFCRFLLLLALTVATSENTWADGLVLDWDASVSTDVAGYNVYYGTNSGNYIYKLDAGNVTSITISNLVCGGTYYFAATAYDSNGNESALSAEISFIVPGAFCIAPYAAGNPGALSFPVAPGHSYEIQATTDLQNWTSIWQSDVMTTNTWTQFIDPDAPSYTQRFYRLVTY